MLTDVWDAYNTEQDHTRISYDPLGRKTGMTDPDMGTWGYAYDDEGNLIHQVDARGQHLYFEYEPLNRLTNTRRDTVDGPVVLNYWYDYYDPNGIMGYGRGRRSGWSRPIPSGGWENYGFFGYDPRGNLDHLAVDHDGDPGTGTYDTEYSYDAADRTRTMTYPDGEVVTYTYNAQGLPASLASNRYGTLVQEATYDEAGRVTQRRLGDPEVLQTNRYYYPWTTLNGRGRLEWQYSGPPTDTGALETLHYTYDSVGNVWEIQDYRAAGGTQTQTFAYDALDRLVTAQASGGSSGTYGPQSYVYDAVGNLTNKASVSYTYPAPGNPRPHAVTGTSDGKSYSYDLNGNMTDRAGDTLVYNAENQLASLTQGTTTTNFQYAWDGTRIRRQVGDDPPTYYIGDDYEIVTNDFVEDFEGDTSHWSTSGLWHVTTRRANSPTHSAWYGQESTGNYSTGGRTSGSLQVTLPGTITGASVLSFNYWRQVEGYSGAYDQTYVQISTDGGNTWSNALWYRDSSNPSQATWLNSGAISLAAYAGVKGAVLRFTFDSVDGYANNYEGWFVDDVMVSWLDTVTKYYTFNGQRVAVRLASAGEAGWLSYLLTDHLGSTSITTNESGAKAAELRYYPYGAGRHTWGTTPTDRQFSETDCCDSAFCNTSRTKVSQSSSRWRLIS